MGIDLSLIWILIIAFGLMMYVIMDGSDLGIGILFPFVPLTAERDLMVNTVAPVRFASAARITPMLPCPITSTVSSGSRASILIALKQVLTGSINAACSNGMSSGIRIRPDGVTPSPTIQSITRMYSANPPPEGSPVPAVVPTFLYCSHCANVCFRQ